MKNFAHLKVASCYSPGYGVSTIKEIAEACKSSSIATASVRDIQSLTSAADVSEVFAANSIKPIYATSLRIQTAPASPSAHVGFLAETQQGWENLLQIFASSHSPLDCWEVLRSCPSDITCMIPGETVTQDKQLAAELQTIFPAGHIFIELEAYHKPTKEPRLEQSEAHLQTILQMSQETELPLAAVWDIRYAYPEQKTVWKNTACIARKGELDDLAIWTDEDKSKRHLRSAEESVKPFLQLPAGEEAVKNTLMIAERTEMVNPWHKKARLPIPQIYANEKPDITLRKLVAENAPNRWESVPQERLEHELNVICDSGYATYFLIVHETINWCKQQGIGVGPGRGSVAGCAVAYALGISEADPIEHGLIFERFLNVGRKQMPDIDIDFEDLRRDEVIDHLRDTYGKECVGHVIVFSEFKSKNSLKDIARISGYEPAAQDEQASRVPDDIAGVQPRLSMLLSPFKPETDDEDQHAFWRRGKSIRELEGSERRVAEEAAKLEGRIRHFGMHAAAVIISDAPIKTYIPCKMQDNILVAQYDAKNCEKMGLLKLDVLGLKMVRILERSMQAVGMTYSEIPFDDPATMEMIGRGETDGIFQMESHACRDMCQMIKPSRFADIVAIAAMNRPGPLAQDTHKKYAAAVHGDFAHYKTLPDRGLEQLLSETYGLLLYQEQIMQIGEHYAGMTLEETDEMRRISGKKDRDAMQGMYEVFVNGCERNKYPRSVAESLWKWVQPFAAYGFNKSHAVAYSLISYYSAWLANHHPAVFFAELARASGEVERSGLCLLWARRKGITIYPPSIKEPVVHHTPTSDGKGIRFGIGTIKGVGKAANGIWKEHISQGEFADLADLNYRFPELTKNKRVRDALAASGVLLPFGKEAVQTEQQRTETMLLAKLHEADTEVEEPVSKTLSIADMKNVCGLQMGVSDDSSMSPPEERGWKPVTDRSGWQPKGNVGIWGIVNEGVYKTSKNGKPYFMFQLNSQDGSTSIRCMKMLPATESSWNEQPENGSIGYVTGRLADSLERPMVFVTRCESEAMPESEIDSSLWEAKGVSADKRDLHRGYLMSGVTRIHAGSSLKEEPEDVVVEAVEEEIAIEDVVVVEQDATPQTGSASVTPLQSETLF